MRMPSKIDDQMFAPCGMNCMVCYKHCYTKKNKTAMFRMYGGRLWKA